RPPRVVPAPAARLDGLPTDPPWRPTISPAEHALAVAEIHRRIERGETYQVNYTFPIEAPFADDPWTLFSHLRRGLGPAGYAAYLDLAPPAGDFAICSASPELFFHRGVPGEDGLRPLVARPMKGTSRRGRYGDEDRTLRGELGTEKNRAENLMIVDMVRNDLGRIAHPGSVRVARLFGVETYPTVHQMTSDVEARSDAPWSEVAAALFPCASITGAPKVRTSRLIRGLETGPRGIYTGSIGYLAPDGRSQMNVAIRTAVVDRRRGVATYGVGGGIVWDSEAEAEWQEARAKALALDPGHRRGVPDGDFELFETLLWRRRRGYFLLERHLQRLSASAAHLGFAADRSAEGALEAAARGFAEDRYRVRLRLRRDGHLSVDAEPFPCTGRRRWRVVLDDRPVDDANPFLFHKTSRREVYDDARARHPDADDVLLWNRRRELTESTVANLVLKVDGRWLTPPIRCGLLAGTYRAELLARGRLHEEVLTVDDLGRAEGIFLVNALRGWLKVALAP
ncbi:MAG: chorismate-binding protein, partial [Acidobacteriota bacterium]